MTKVLTQRTVEAAQPHRRKAALTKADGIVPGMQFIVHAGGKKSFRLIARIHGKQVNLDDRRRLAADAGRRPRQGQAHARPDRQRRGSARGQAGGRQGRVGDRRGRRPEGSSSATPRPTTATWKETERGSRHEIIPVWGRAPDQPPSSRADVVALLDAIVDRGGAGDRPTGRSPTARKMFNWAASAARSKTSPFDRRQGRRRRKRSATASITMPNWR